jgi:dipeptidyl-peptidase-4
MRKLSTAIIALLFFLCCLFTAERYDHAGCHAQCPTTLAPENLKGLQFIKGTNDYAYMKKINGVDGWVTGNFKSERISLFSTLRSSMRNSGQHRWILSQRFLPMQLNKDSWIFSLKGQRIALNPNNNTYKILISKDLSSKENVEESSEGYVAYVDNFNLFVSKDNDVKKVTEDGSKDIVYASSVHQSEFGITKVHSGVIMGSNWHFTGWISRWYRIIPLSTGRSVRPK